MGGALLDGWLKQGVISSNITVIEPNNDTATALRTQYKVATKASPDDFDLDKKPNVIIFAVKPQIMDVVAPSYARFAETEVVYLSIAAGKTISYYENVLGRNASIVRAMPNTPAAVSRGITVYCTNTQANSEQISLCEHLLSSIGEVARTENEGHIDIVTALSIESFVIILEGVKSSQTISSILLPTSVDILIWLESAAGIELAPGKHKPIASAIAVIVLAVPIVIQ